jgi:hypothetical protein
MLIFGGYNSHIGNLNIIQLARRKNVTTVRLPPHSLKKLQHFDKSFIGPLKISTSEEVQYKDALLPISMWPEFSLELTLVLCFSAFLYEVPFFKMFLNYLKYLTFLNAQDSLSCSAQTTAHFNFLLLVGF